MMLECNLNYDILDPSCMGMGRSTVNVPLNVHGYTNVCWELGSVVQWSSSRVTVWKSSFVMSSEVWLVFTGDGCTQTMGC